MLQARLHATTSLLSSTVIHFPPGQSPGSAGYGRAVRRRRLERERGGVVALAVMRFQTSMAVRDGCVTGAPKPAGDAPIQPYSGFS